MSFLYKLKLAYFTILKFSNEKILNDFSDFCDFAYNRFPLVNIENQDVTELGEIYYGLMVNLDKLKSNTLDESNLITPIKKNFEVEYYETYSVLTRYTYVQDIEAPTPEIAKKIFSYSVDQGYIDNNSFINKHTIDTEFEDEGITSVKEKSDQKSIKESTRKIVKELFERKLNK